jgi:hypothetical protein
MWIDTWQTQFFKRQNNNTAMRRPSRAAITSSNITVCLAIQPLAASLDFNIVAWASLLTDQQHKTHGSLESRQRWPPIDSCILSFIRYPNNKIANKRGEAVLCTPWRHIVEEGGGGRRRNFRPGEEPTEREAGWAHVNDNHKMRVISLVAEQLLASQKPS